MSINIDDREVKQILKDGLQIKESDLRTPIRMVPNVQPVFLLNDATLNQFESSTVPGNGLYVTPFDDYKIRKILVITFKQENTETNAKNITFTAENIEGTVFTSGVVSALNNTQYYIHLIDYANSAEFEFNTNDRGISFPAGVGLPLKNLKFLQGSASGTAQTWVIRMWYIE